MSLSSTVSTSVNTQNTHKRSWYHHHLGEQSALGPEKIHKADVKEGGLGSDHDAGVTKTGRRGQTNSPVRAWKRRLHSRIAVVGKRQSQAYF